MEHITYPHISRGLKIDSSVFDAKSLDKKEPKYVINTANITQLAPALKQ